MRPVWRDRFWMRPVIRRLVQICVAGFVFSVGVGMFTYPGGTWRNPRAMGHSFWQNFLCDLLHDPALNHRNNAVGATFTKIGMLLIVIGLSSFWWLVADRLCCHRKLRALVRRLGTFGSPLVATVPLFPSDHFPSLHTAAVTLGGLPAMITLLLFNVALFVEPHGPKWVRILTTALTVLSVVCMGLYVRESVLHRASLIVLPVLERLATLTVVFWMLALLPRDRDSLRR